MGLVNMNAWMIEVMNAPSIFWGFVLTPFCPLRPGLSCGVLLTAERAWYNCEVRKLLLISHRQLRSVARKTIDQAIREVHCRESQP